MCGVTAPAAACWLVAVLLAAVEPPGMIGGAAAGDAVLAVLADAVGLDATVKAGFWVGLKVVWLVGAAVVAMLVTGGTGLAGVVWPAIATAALLWAIVVGAGAGAGALGVTGKGATALC